MKLITCKKLKVGYDNKAVLKNINLTIEAGDFIGIFGANGSGKSTLIKTLVKLLPPLGGKIKYDESIKHSAIGYLPQEIKAQPDFPATAYEVVISGCVNRLGLRAFYNKEERDLALRYMRILNIEKLKNKSFRELSGGEKQKVLLARALTSCEKVLFLDEPFNALDEKTREQLYHTLSEINKQYGVSIIMISHDNESTIKYVNRVIEIDETIKFDGLTQEYLKRKEVNNNGSNMA